MSRDGADDGDQLWGHGRGGYRTMVALDRRAFSSGRGAHRDGGEQMDPETGLSHEIEAQSPLRQMCC